MQLLVSPERIYISAGKHHIHSYEASKVHDIVVDVTSSQHFASVTCRLQKDAVRVTMEQSHSIGFTHTLYGVRLTTVCMPEPARLCEAKELWQPCGPRHRLSHSAVLLH